MKRILVIEDGKALREEIAMTLQCLEFEVIEAENGRIGVELAKAQLPDLIICDIMMPELDGYGVFTELRQEPETSLIPFIFLSAKADRSDIRQGMNLGADDYLTKPFTLEELSEAITARLEKQSALTQPYIQEMKRAVEQLNQLAYHDPLTGLPNRLLLRHRLQEAVLSAKRSNRPVAVFCLNLQRFKVINTTLGYLAGDLLLQSVAERLRGLIPVGDIVARLSGDEFSIILVNAEQLNISQFAQELLQVLAEPYNLQGHNEICIYANIGITLFPDDPVGPDLLLDHALMAMHSIKHQGNQYQFYSRTLDEQAAERRMLESSLYRAIERSEFQIYYQPQLNLITGRIVGAEALIRWQHPELGTVYPATFVSLAEENGLIIPIGDWVLKTACQQAKHWQASSPFPVRVSVNLSARQFENEQLVSTIAQYLSEAELDPRLLGLEFTETSVMENVELTISALEQLKDMGIQVAIDDFGTGYSSLSYLKRLPVSTLKIDQSFVADIHEESSGASIVTAIIAMSKSLKFNVIAEGVETKRQLDFLRQNGCHMMQGYLFSPPIPASEFEKMLIEDRRL